MRYKMVHSAQSTCIYSKAERNTRFQLFRENLASGAGAGAHSGEFGGDWRVRVLRLGDGEYGVEHAWHVSWYAQYSRRSSLVSFDCEAVGLEARVSQDGVGIARVQRSAPCRLCKLPSPPYVLCSTLTAIESAI